MEDKPAGGMVELPPDVQINFEVSVAPEPLIVDRSSGEKDAEDLGKADSLLEAFPLLSPVERSRTSGIHRVSVTQLINYQRCPRQYYFDRVLQLPTADELSVWNNAEAPEPPANLTAALKGAVIHRFCERYTMAQDVETCLRNSFTEVVRLRQTELADRVAEINSEAAIKDLLPLAKNYLVSDVFARVEKARASGSSTATRVPDETGLCSELSFRLRRPLGVVSGAIDKLLINKTETGYDVEIVDFKTNRLPKTVASKAEHQPALIEHLRSPQFAFDFDAKPTSEPHNALEAVAKDYQLQMQAYALAIHELLPKVGGSKIRITLHFLEPNLEFSLDDSLLETDTCKAAIDSAMFDIISSAQPQDFPVKPELHCRTCNFLRVCAAGREFVQSV